jgi:hypothetical protein
MRRLALALGALASTAALAAMVLAAAAAGDL